MADKWLLKALWGADGALLKITGQYLKSFDFEADGGAGFGEFTRDPLAAKHFDGLPELFEFVRTVPKCHPIRASDGKPNRPMTAVTYDLVKLQDVL